MKHASGRNIKRATGRSTKVCSFPGANSKKVSEHSHIELKYFSPKTVIIHAGGNDLAEGKRSDDVLKQVSDLGHSLKEKGVKNIAVSAVTPRTKLKWEIKNLNHVLKNECRSQGFDLSQIQTFPSIIMFAQMVYISTMMVSAFWKETSPIIYGMLS